MIEPISFFRSIESAWMIISSRAASRSTSSLPSWRTRTPLRMSPDFVITCIET